MEFRRLISLLILSLAMSRCVHGQWSSAHATFYGGGDASGTMGKTVRTKTLHQECLALIISLA